MDQALTLKKTCSTLTIRPTSCSEEGAVFNSLHEFACALLGGIKLFRVSSSARVKHSVSHGQLQSPWNTAWRLVVWARQRMNYVQQVSWLQQHCATIALWRQQTLPGMRPAVNGAVLVVLGFADTNPDLKPVEERVRERNEEETNTHSCIANFLTSIGD